MSESGNGGHNWSTAKGNGRAPERKAKLDFSWIAAATHWYSIVNDQDVVLDEIETDEASAIEWWQERVRALSAEIEDDNEFRLVRDLEVVVRRRSVRVD